MTPAVGWHNVGWHNPDMITPNSDALVAEGVELDRHYVYMYCSPTRSSFHSGRFPYHVNQIILSNDGAVPDWGVPKEMTLLPLKLKAAGYATHAAGKWHIGFQSEALLPTSRGYDSYLGYLQGSMDHWTQAEDAAYLPAGIAPMQPYGEFPGLPNVWMKAAGWNHSNVIDWWWNADGMLPGGGGPAVGLNGSLFHLGANGQVVGDEDAYTDRQTTDQAILNVRRHNSTQPMFQYVAFQNCHAPLEAPDRHIEMYPKEWREDRRWYAGMVTYWDEAVGNITAAYKAAGMWDRTLMVLTTDNGGCAHSWTQLRCVDVNVSGIVSCLQTC
jgi:arylsulfatase B